MLAWTVVAYNYEKDRQRDGKSLGKRTMKLKLADSGGGAAIGLYGADPPAASSQ